MSRTFIIVATIATITATVAAAGPKEVVAAATQSWFDAMNCRDPERVVALYDREAVWWGTVSPVLRDTPAAIRDYFKCLPGFPPEFRGGLGEQRVRVYGDIAISTGTYTFTSVRNGTPTTTPARYSFVYRHRDGQWLIVGHHSSAFPAPPQWRNAPRVVAVKRSTSAARRWRC
jgi:uncharacterized protein (TIGR02246 family)